MIFLAWWVYPIIAATVFTTMLAAYRVESWRERRENGQDIPFGPCLAYLGTTDDGVLQYCGRLDGHEEECGGEIILTFPQPILAPVQDRETTEFGYVQLDPGSPERPYVPQDPWDAFGPDVRARYLTPESDDRPGTGHSTGI